MESATLCWILDDEDATTNPENTENIGKEGEKKTIAAQKKENKSEDVSSTDNLEATANDSCDGLNDGRSSMKTTIVDEQQRTKKSSYTLTDINFKIKKGTSLNL